MAIFKRKGKSNLIDQVTEEILVSVRQELVAELKSKLRESVTADLKPKLEAEISHNITQALVPELRQDNDTEPPHMLSGAESARVKAAVAHNGAVAHSHNGKNTVRTQIFKPSFDNRRVRSVVAHAPPVVFGLPCPCKRPALGRRWQS